MPKRPAAAASSAGGAAALPAQALYVRPEWCRAIFAGAKRWELRSTRTTKRGPVCIAESGARRLVGRAVIVDCFAVGAHGADGRWAPVGTRGRGEVGAQAARIVDRYQRLFAWVLADVEAFEPPLRRLEPCSSQTWLAGRVRASPSPAAGAELAVEPRAKARRAARKA